MELRRVGMRWLSLTLMVAAILALSFCQGCNKFPYAEYRKELDKDGWVPDYSYSPSSSSSPALKITTTTLPEGVVGETYGSRQLTATGGKMPYTWSEVENNLGRYGFTLTSRGIISGTPIQVGTCNFSASVTDSGSPAQIRTKALSITVTSLANNPPTVTITSGPANGSTVATSQVTFGWTGSDTDGTVVGFYYSFDINPPVIWTTNTFVTSNPLSDGQHTFHVLAVDDDYVSSTVASCTFAVDTTTVASRTFAVDTTTPSPLLEADFTADRTSGVTPLIVTFTDISTGVISSWAWDFDNDGTLDSTAQNPTHVYDVPGYYTVNLRVTGPLGSTAEQKTDYVGSGIEVGGLISSDTVWSTSNGPIFIVGSTLVQAEVTLTIEPGVEVMFDGYYRIQVEGELVARGTQDNRILFTSNRTSPAMGDWQALLLENSCTDAVVDGDGDYVSGTILEYCEISYGGPLQAYGCSPYIANNYIHHVSGAAPIDWPTGAIWTAGSSITIIKDNVISDNGISGVCCSDRGGSGNVMIVNNIIKDNSAGWGGGIGIFNGGTVTIRHNTIERNSASEIGGGIAIYRGTHTIEDNLIANNSCTSTQDDRGGSAIGSWSNALSAQQNTIVDNTGDCAIHLNRIDTSMALTHNKIINSGAVYEVYVSDYALSVNPVPTINATNNYWGTTNAAMVESRIHNFLDEFSQPLVDINPLATAFIEDFPAITTTSLPEGSVGQAYLEAVQAAGGTTPYTWSIESGQLPPGLYLSSSTGQIDGTPSVEGTFTFTIGVMDSAGNTDTRQLSMTITSSGGGGGEVTIYADQADSTGYVYNTSTRNTGDVRTANGVFRGWMKFNLSALPAGAIVTRVTVHWYVSNPDANTFDVTELSEDPVTSDAATIWNDTNSGTTYLNAVQETSTGWKSHDLGSQAQSDVESARSDKRWFGLGLPGGGC